MNGESTILRNVSIQLDLCSSFLEAEEVLLKAALIERCEENRTLLLSFGAVHGRESAFVKEKTRITDQVILQLLRGLPNI